MRILIFTCMIFLTGCASQPILTEEGSPVKVENICEIPENKDTFIYQKKT